jgi:5-methylcytosine-specific restriction endonuclease McrA
MDEELTNLVWQRARHCCEYCHLHQDYSRLTFEIDHIIARQHGGKTVAGNLALTCFYCNRFKGPNIASRDPRSRKIVSLFHPLRHKWSRHFRWKGAVLVGLTPNGRATVLLLNVNDAEAVATREALIAAGLFDPTI